MAVRRIFIVPAELRRLCRTAGAHPSGSKIRRAGAGGTEGSVGADGESAGTIKIRRTAIKSRLYGRFRRCYFRQNIVQYE